ncbi:putative oxidoreductase [Armadillidium vulgare]|nr:putative oxidoreductase [Armadillidium vulgare]
MKLKGIDVCINNAGMAVENALLDGEPSEWKQMMSVNVISATLLSKLAVESMKEREVNDGHIIFINSIAGHKIITIKEYSFYSATKHALKVLAEGLRLELQEMKLGIKVSSVSPGLVQTEFFENSPKLKDIFQQSPNLRAEDLADIVNYVLSTPPQVEINELIVTPVP